MWDPQWEKLFLFSLNYLSDATCMVCFQKIKQKRKQSIKRHYDSCHSEMEQITGDERDNLVAKLKKDFELENNRQLNIIVKSSAASSSSPSSSSSSQPLLTFNPSTSNSFPSSDCQLKATYSIALCLAKNNKPFDDGTFLKETMLSILPFFGDAGTKVEAIIKEIPLSSQTLTRRAENISHFIHAECKERIANAKFLSICFSEENPLSSVTSSLTICLRTVDDSFNEFEEILKFETFSGHVTDYDAYATFEKHVIPIIDKRKLTAICSDDVENKQHFFDHLIKNGIQVPTFPCVKHQQNLFAKSFGFSKILESVVKIIKHLKKCSITRSYQKLIAFLKHLDIDYTNILLYTTEKLSNRAKILEQLFSLREDILVFLNSQESAKDNDIKSTLTNPDFLLDLGFLTDITVYINDLSLVLQTEHKTIFDIFQAIQLFSQKLVLLKEQLTFENLTNLPKVSEIYQKYSNSPKLQLFCDELDKLMESFQIYFKHIFELEYVFEIFNNPIYCSLDKLPETLQIELQNMRQDLFIPVERGMLFWRNLCINKYPNCRDLILKTYSKFYATSLCDSSFSAMTQIRNKYRVCLTDHNLETLLKIKLYNKDIDMEKLIQFHKQ